MEEGVEGAPNNLIDGKTGTDVALNNKGFWFTVDLGEAKVLTGIKTNRLGKMHMLLEKWKYYSLKMV